MLRRSHGGQTYHFGTDEKSGSIILPAGIGEESALAETPDGGIFLSSRNKILHGPGKCDCRASVRFAKGGDTFGAMFPSLGLPEPECEATMINVGDSAELMWHANPGHGTDGENKSPPDGRASGTVRLSRDGGRTWEASLVLNGAQAYSYSCLSEVRHEAHGAHGLLHARLSTAHTAIYILVLVSPSHSQECSFRKPAGGYLPCAARRSSLGN